MDVIETSHFEAIKQFLLDRPWWEMKLFRYENNWNVVLNNETYIDPDRTMIFVHTNLGKAFETASIWIGEQYAIQKREAETLSLDEPSGDSETLDERARLSNSSADQTQKS